MPGLDRNLGRVAFLCKQYGNAITSLSRYLEQHADDTTVRSELALSLFQREDYAGVVRVLEPIKTSLSSNAELARAYSIALEKTNQK